MALINFHCEVCREWIGRIDPEKIHLPLTPFMFLPLSDDPMCKPPFLHTKDLEWEYFQCPICKKRPFLDPKRLFIGNGYLDVSEKSKQEEVFDNATFMDGSKEIVFPIEILTKKEIQERFPSPFICTHPGCGKDCGSNIGRISHMRTHKKVN